MSVGRARSSAAVYSSAGHPPMLCVAPDGSLTWLDQATSSPNGPLLNVPRSNSTASFGAGSTMIAFTDGLVERRRRPIHDGLDELDDVAATLASVDLDDACETITRHFAREPFEDDVALLCLRTQPEPDSS